MRGLISAHRLEDSFAPPSTWIVSPLIQRASPEAKFDILVCTTPGARTFHADTVSPEDRGEMLHQPIDGAFVVAYADNVPTAARAASEDSIIMRLEHILP